MIQLLIVNGELENFGAFVELDEHELCLIAKPTPIIYPKDIFFDSIAQTYNYNLVNAESFNPQTQYWDITSQSIKAKVIPFDYSAYTVAVQTLLDTGAQAVGYDGILSACTYVDDVNPRFAVEGTLFKSWRSNCWAKCYELLTQTEAGAITIPTIPELLALLPECPVTPPTT